MKPLDSALTSIFPWQRGFAIEPRYVLQTLGTACPVAVVEVHLLALKHECADAILSPVRHDAPNILGANRSPYLALGHCPKSFHCHCR